MTAYTYNAGVPAANDDPSVDQPDMLTNAQSINSLIGTDHVSFNSTGSGGVGAIGGQHLQVTFNGKNVPGAQTDPISTLYTNSGTASTKAEMFFKNQNGIFPASCIKAFASWVHTTISPIVPITSFNINSITIAATIYTITLTANATTGNAVVPIVSVSYSGGNISTATYSFVGGVLTLSFLAPIVNPVGARISILILQV